MDLYTQPLLFAVAQYGVQGATYSVTVGVSSNAELCRKTVEITMVLAAVVVWTAISCKGTEVDRD